MEISGDIQAADTRVAMATLSRRIYRGLWPWLAGMLALLIAGMFVAPWAMGIVLPQRLVNGLSVPSIFVLTTVWVVAIMRFTQAWTLRAWQGRGLVYPMPTSYRLDERGLEVITPLWRATYAWTGVSEIAASPGGWVLIVPALGYEAPRRLFRDADEERAFVRAVLERMTDAARDRSRKAQDFVGTWG